MEDVSRIRRRCSHWWVVFLEYAAAPGTSRCFLRYSSWTPRIFFISTKNTFLAGFELPALTPLPKLFKYVRSWSNRKASFFFLFFFSGARGRQELPPVGCWGSDMKTGGKNKGLSGLLKTSGPEQPIKIHSVKQAWNTRRLQAPLKHVKTPLLSGREYGVKTGRHEAFSCSNLNQ